MVAETGNFPFGRFHSKHIALHMSSFPFTIILDCFAKQTRFAEIKAMEEDVFGERYSTDE